MSAVFDNLPDRDSAEKPQAKRIPGKHFPYSLEITGELCSRIANGEGLTEICRDPTMPTHQTIYTWLCDPEKAAFLEAYTCAREVQAELYAAQIVSISDDGRNDTYLDENGNRKTDHDVIARSKLRVEARKWVAAKLLPKKYGDRTFTESTVKVEVDITPRKDQLRQMLGINQVPTESRKPQLPAVRDVVTLEAVTIPAVTVTPVTPVTKPAKAAKPVAEPECKSMTNAERQKAYRERKAALKTQA